MSFQFSNLIFSLDQIIFILIWSAQQKETFWQNFKFLIKTRAYNFEKKPPRSLSHV